MSTIMTSVQTFLHGGIVAVLMKGGLVMVPLSTAQFLLTKRQRLR